MNLNFLVPIISFLGLIIGLIISSMTQEEVLAGRNIFKILRKTLLSILILIVLIIIILNFNLILVALVLLIGVLLARKFKNLNISYLSLGLISVSSLMMTKSLFFIISVLIFIYGLLYGALMKNKLEIILSNALMFFLPFIILIIPFISFGETLTFSVILLIFELRKI